MLTRGERERERGTVREGVCVCFFCTTVSFIFSFNNPANVFFSNMTSTRTTESTAESSVSSQSRCTQHGS